MSDGDRKPKGRYDDLPKMRTPSGRWVYDPGQAPAPGTNREVLRRLLEEARDLENADARDAVPEPTEAAAANDGAILAAGEDAAKAHAAAVIEPRAVPHMPSAPVRIAEMLDARKVTTARIAKAPPAPPAGEAARTDEASNDAPQSVWAREAAAKVPAIDKDALPSATAPSSRPPPSVTTLQQATQHGGPRVNRRWIAASLALAALVVIGIAVVRGGMPAQPEASAPSAPSTIKSAPAIASGAPGTTTSEVESMGTSMMKAAPPSASQVPSTLPSATTASPSAPPTPSVPPAPKSSAPSGVTTDPYSAGAPLKPATTVESSAGPVVTAAPSAAPAAPPATATPKSTSDRWFQKEQ